MINKTFFNSIFIGCCCIGFTMFSCQTPEQKVDDAFSKAREEKMTPDSVVIKETKYVNRPQILNEYASFKAQSEKQIISNSEVILKLKSRPGQNVKMAANVIRLEKDNLELTAQLQAYEQEVQLNLKNFKLKIDQQVADLAIAIKDAEAQAPK
jgi:hypothetical protein